MEIAKRIIQILLYEGGSMKKEDLGKFLNLKKDDIESNILEIENLLAVLDLHLIKTTTSLEISLNQEVNSLIEKNKIEDLKTDLSESALQTLAVVLYKDKATKAEIDFVRGVDSSRSLKNLLNRGIIEKLEEKSRRYYIPTTETLRYLNLDSVDKIPDFLEISDKLRILIQGE